MVRAEQWRRIVVKWFNPTKGYGFIQPSGAGGKDVFVYISPVERAGLNSLNEGQVVEYEIEEQSGPRVCNQPQDQVTVLLAQPAELAAFECRTCGACCSFSSEWPRFSLESDADLDRIPRDYVDSDLGRMRCNGNRCAALVGEVGVSTACSIYTVRPNVCRACLPGDDSCKIARRHFSF
jgi:cold shock CspA family protein